MPWLKISVEASGASAEALSERMLACGALSVSFGCVGAADDEVLEPPPGAAPLWPRVTVVGLFPATVDVRALNSALGPAGASHMEFLGDQDWVAAGSSNVPELRFGDRLAVMGRAAPLPHSMSTPQAKGSPGAVLRLDPGLAFGTGQHPTTGSCLAWLADADLEGRSVLDYGCGSGILGIAAALLGAARVVAVDIEPQALWATQANANFNGVRLHAVTTAGEFQAQSEFDLVLANILANALIELGPTLSGCLNSGGRLVLAGLLESQVGAVKAAYPGLDFEPPLIDGGWARLTGRRRG